MSEKCGSLLRLLSTVFVIGLLLILSTALICAPRFAFAAVSPVTFDFDTGAPALVIGQNTPLSQSSGGITAYFTSVSDPNKFSVQSLFTNPNIQLSKFSGRYLYDNSPVYGDSIDIKFNLTLSSINFTFATFEFHGPTGQDPSNMTLIAYLDSNSTLVPWQNTTYLAPVGSMITHGVWPTNDTYPQGTLFFNSSQPFNLVRIQCPYQGVYTAVGFAIDNVVATDFNIVPEFSPTIMFTVLLSAAFLVLVAKKKIIPMSVATPHRGYKG